MGETNGNWKREAAVDMRGDGTQSRGDGCVLGRALLRRNGHRRKGEKGGKAGERGKIQRLDHPHNLISFKLIFSRNRESESENTWLTPSEVQFCSSPILPFLILLLCVLGPLSFSFSLPYLPVINLDFAEPLLPL